MVYDGIDHGHGKTNRNKDGISFGTINANEVAGWIWDYVEPYYPKIEPGDLHDIIADYKIKFDDDKNIYIDLNDGEEIDADDLYDALRDRGWEDRSEPLYHYYSKDGLTFKIDNEYNDIVVFESLVISTGTYCNPCFPGGVSLGTEGSIPCLALPTDFFDEYNPCPYETQPYPYETQTQE